MTAVSPSHHWDIFCKVVDNFGDIGVCWRLARQLADEHGILVRLWVDDWSLAHRFAGGGHAGITLQHWTPVADFSAAAEVVIETFGCGIPEAYQQAMRCRQSVWLNVDYLSAEAWVETFHGQPSPQANGLIRHFFYPGFTAHTGGLLREAGLADLQKAASQHAAAFWQRLGCQPFAGLNLSLFCYAHAPVAALLDSLADAEQAVRVLVPESVAPVVATVLGRPHLGVGEVVRYRQCCICVIPFLSQPDYDCLLSLCDLNFVRGEDSWIRAIWAGKPMVWLPYQQTEGTHLLKLEAFLDHALATASDEVACAVRGLMLAWADGELQTTDLQRFMALHAGITAHTQLFAQALSQQPDLTTKLVFFIEKLRKNRV